MQKRRSCRSIDLQTACVLLQPDPSYVASNCLFRSLDHVARDKWSHMFEARAWELACLWNDLDPDLLGPSAAYLQRRLSLVRGPRAFAFFPALWQQESAAQDPGRERCKQLLDSLDGIKGALTSGELPHICAANCRHGLDALVAVGEFHDWAVRFHLPRCHGWRPRSSDEPGSGWTYVRLPGTNHEIELMKSAMSHFESWLQPPAVSPPTVRDVLEFLTKVHGEPNARLAGRIAVLLRPSGTRPGPRPRRRGASEAHGRHTGPRK